MIFADIPTPTGAPGGRTTTFANGIQTNRQMVFTLDDVSVITLDVQSNDPQVNVLDADGYPPVAQTKRIVYAFRREGPGSPNRPAGYDPDAPWVIRAAGIVMIVEDQADTDVPLTHITAYDPWKVLEARPVVTLTDELPDAMGFPSWGIYGLNGTDVIGYALKATIDSLTGGFCFIDAGTLYGGTPYYGGTLEDVGQVLIDIQQGDSVADVWRNVCEAGFCDIVLTPIYDPIRRPGYTHELNVFILAGQNRPSAVLSWDKMNRAASSIDRLHDATPGNFSNIVQYYVGQGGPPAPLQINAASINDFGRYWSTQFFPDQTIPSGAVVQALANQALYLSRQGKRTITLDLLTERAPVALTEYGVGDFLPIWVTDTLRVAITSSFGVSPPAAFRVSALPILVSDDGIETISGLIVSPDWRTSPYLVEVPAVIGTGIGLKKGAATPTLLQPAAKPRRRTVYHLKKPLT